MQEVLKRNRMARFIVIDRSTGQVYGDTAQFGLAGDVLSPADAVCLLDRHTGRARRGFGYVGRHSESASYDVYEISPFSQGDATEKEAHTHALIREHGTFVAALIVYNS